MSKSKVKTQVVDTRASKGRKIQYTLMPKLQNFMAPVPLISSFEEISTELFSTLFK